MGVSMNILKTSLLYIPLCCTFMVSQMCTELSSLPQNKRRPDSESPQDVKPEVLLGGVYKAICWSDLISYSLAVLSSDPVTNALPLG